MTANRVHSPTALQESVLRAALLPPSEALDEWRGLLAGGDIPDLDQGSFRLLPLVSRNLGALSEEVPARARLKGIYRQAWYRNRVAAAAVSPVLRELSWAGIEAMLLKGLAAVQLAYQDIGARPMNDADILVRPRDFRAARRIAIDAGFQPVSGIGRGEGFRTFHAVAFRDPKGMDIDIHHHMLEESCWPGADEDTWIRAMPALFGDVPVILPAAEDLLINICIHGTRWDPVPPVRWIADATLLSRGHALDWDIIVGEAQRRRVTVAMQAALVELSRFTPVPPATIAALGMMRTGWLERADFRAQQAGTSTATMVARYLTRYGRLSSRRKFRRKVTGFPTYLQGMWELDSRRDVYREGVRRVVLRARGREPRRGAQDVRSSLGSNSA